MVVALWWLPNPQFFFSIKNNPKLQSQTRFAAQILSILLFPLPLNHKWFKVQQAARLRTTVVSKSSQVPQMKSIQGLILPSRHWQKPIQETTSAPQCNGSLHRMQSLPSVIYTTFTQHLQNSAVWPIILTRGAAPIQTPQPVQHKIYRKSKGAHHEEEPNTLKACLLICTNVHPRF